MFRATRNLSRRSNVVTSLGPSRQDKCGIPLRETGHFPIVPFAGSGYGDVGIGGGALEEMRGVLDEEIGFPSVGS